MVRALIIEKLGDAVSEVKDLVKTGVDFKKAVKIVSAEYNISKRELASNSGVSHQREKWLDRMRSVFFGDNRFPFAEWSCDADEATAGIIYLYKDYQSVCYRRLDHIVYEVSSLLVKNLKFGPVKEALGQLKRRGLFNKKKKIDDIWHLAINPHWTSLTEQETLATKSIGTRISERAFGKNKAIARWEYENEAGTRRYWKVKEIKDDGISKNFYYTHEDDDGLIKYGMGGSPLPYRLLELTNNKTNNVFLAEGEKDADSLANAGFTPATSFKDWPKEYDHLLEGKELCLFCDNDLSGVRLAKTFHIDKKSIVNSIHRIEFGNFSKRGYDVSDYILEFGAESLKQLLADEVKHINKED